MVKVWDVLFEAFAQVDEGLQKLDSEENVHAREIGLELVISYAGLEDQYRIMFIDDFIQLVHGETLEKMKEEARVQSDGKDPRST